MVEYKAKEVPKSHPHPVYLKRITNFSYSSYIPVGGYTWSVSGCMKNKSRDILIEDNRYGVNFHTADFIEVTKEEYEQRTKYNFSEWAYNSAVENRDQYTQRILKEAITRGFIKGAKISYTVEQGSAETLVHDCRIYGNNTGSYFKIDALGSYYFFFKENRIEGGKNPWIAVVIERAKKVSVPVKKEKVQKEIDDELPIEIEAVPEPVEPVEPVVPSNWKEEDIFESSMETKEEYGKRMLELAKQRGFVVGATIQHKTSGKIETIERELKILKRERFTIDSYTLESYLFLSNTLLIPSQWSYNVIIDPSDKVDKIVNISIKDKQKKERRKVIIEKEIIITRKKTASNKVVKIEACKNIKRT